jgi:hypothetical protein
MFYMNLPHTTVPYLLDDVSQRTRDAYKDQGGGAYIVVVDLDGRVAYADYHQDIPPHWGPRAVSFHDEFVFIRMNHLESRLKSFFANGCRYAKGIGTPYPTWRKPPEVTGEVVSLAADGRAVEVAVAAGRRDTRRRRFAVGPAARVTVDHEPTKPAALKRGDRVRVVWRPAEGHDRGHHVAAEARLVAAVRDKAAAGKRAHTIWLAGRVTAVDAERRVLTVERHKPDVTAMRGWQFWQAAGPRATPYDPETKARLDVVRRWVRAGDAARTVRLVIDDAVELFLNGHAVRMTALKPGDDVGVMVRTSQEGRPRVLPEQVRAYRFARP